MKAIITGGGTAGHINPALAIAACIKKHEKDSEILFIGTERGLEKTLVPKAGYEIKYIDVQGIARSLSPENIRTIKKAVKSYKMSREIIEDFKPDIVIGTGGYVCGPVLLAASKLKIPTIIHEQNIPPGLVVKMLRKRVDITAISFSETETLLKKAKRIELTGNPVRDGILNIKNTETERPLVLVSGGSLGAKRINDALLEVLTLQGQDYYDIYAATGTRFYDEFMEEASKRAVKFSEQKRVVPYIYDMDKALSEASLAVTRAGAITISELAAMGKPAIIIPSPNVVHDHQTSNARFMEKSGAAVMITEKDLSGELLAKKIKELLGDKEKLKKMSSCGKKIGITDAADKIYYFSKELIDAYK
ncbi:MAG: undecaprenyldiphospho-muramoylpentapeptide beta-N-acetylglucosaminyltransferase [Clostridia bacterium]|nr:undecaprenyldiphospho-muramoylpentapeptide beta-N-acetylglucosaminyltransferase [Clostridia bacterium]